MRKLSLSGATDSTKLPQFDFGDADFVGNRIKGHAMPEDARAAIPEYPLRNLLEQQIVSPCPALGTLMAQFLQGHGVPDRRLRD